MDNTVTISIEEYTELIKDRLTVEAVRKLAVKDSSKYGYSERTSEMIDMLLCVERKKEETA